MLRRPRQQPEWKRNRIRHKEVAAIRNQKAKTISSVTAKEILTMENNYYRITAYNKDLNVCLIADSNGKFEKLWQFLSFFVCKGFEIISVGKEENFAFGNIPKQTST